MNLRHVYKTKGYRWLDLSRSPFRALSNRNRSRGRGRSTTSQRSLSSQLLLEVNGEMKLWCCSKDIHKIKWKNQTYRSRSSNNGSRDRDRCRDMSRDRSRRSTSSQRYQWWKSGQLLLDINGKMRILSLDKITLFKRQLKIKSQYQTYRSRSRIRSVKIRRGDRRDPAVLGAIHRSFVSFVSLRSDSSPSGRVRRRIVIPFFLKKKNSIDSPNKERINSHT